MHDQRDGPERDRDRDQCALDRDGDRQELPERDEQACHREGDRREGPRQGETGKHLGGLDEIVESLATLPPSRDQGVER